MANFAASSSSSSSSPSSMAAFAEASMAIAFPRGDDDLEQDCCSICLELFNSDDPPTITRCKHEYHLHCILEWSQRSKECPICWQSLSLNDPASQELLATVEKERSSRLRNGPPRAVPTVHYFQEDRDSDTESSDELIINERIMQHLAADASRARLRGRERHRHSGLLRPGVLFHASPTSSDERHDLSPKSSVGDTPSSGSPAALNAELSMPVTPNTPIDSRVAFKPRVLYSQSPSARQQRPSPSETPTFSDSFKSKISAASARYKESISKGTRGLKDKLLARNNSVKELSKGVHREMSAGVARMMERFDFTSKKAGVSPSNSHDTVIASNPSKGKAVLENILVQSLNKNGRGKVHQVSPNASPPQMTVVLSGSSE